MHICMVSPGIVPPTHYGGTERVVVWLTAELSRMGHTVTLIAPEGSHYRGPIQVRTFVKPIGNINAEPPDFEFLVPDDADLVHIHFACNKKLNRPVLKTVHGYPFHYSGREVYAAPEEFDDQTCFVSNAHRITCGLPNNPFVYNGLDQSEYYFETNKKDFLLFLGKVDWNVKGLEFALRTAEQTNSKFVIAGDFLDPVFYEQELKQRLTERIRYVGPVGGQQKARLLAYAKALLFPTLWPEPFGLVSIEAMVSGTPVLGTRNGALPEIVKHGKTGFLALRPSETVEHLKLLNSIHPTNCREHVLQWFTSRRMAEEYLALYQKVIRKNMT